MSDKGHYDKTITFSYDTDRSITQFKERGDVSEMGKMRKGFTAILAVLMVLALSLSSCNIPGS